MALEFGLYVSSQRTVQKTADWIRTVPRLGDWVTREDEPDRESCAVVSYKGKVGWFRSVISKIDPKRPSRFFRDWCNKPPTIGIGTKVRGIYGESGELIELGCLDVLYEVAFGFSMWDRECDMVFHDDYREVFVRRSGHLLIDSSFFKSRSLASMLPDDFEIAKGKLCDLN